MANIEEKICRQVEFYFSDVNIVKDVFLKSKIAEDADGFVPLGVLMTFNRVNALTKDIKQLAEALKASEKLVVSEDCLSVRRKDPLPESIQTDKQTVYVKPVPPASTLEDLTAFFGKYGTVLAVWRRYLQRGSDKSASAESRLKPSVFVVFNSKEEAEAFQAAPPEMNGVQLTAKMKLVYLEEKAALLGGKGRKKDTSESSPNRGTKPAARTTPAMPTDSSYRISGCGDIKNFSDVKGLWPAEDQKGVRYVFTPQSDEAVIIFQDSETAAKMVESVNQRAATLNGVQPKITKVEGEDEKKLIEDVEKEIADRASLHAASRGRGRGRGHGKRMRD
ncbi:unnamed protein product [Phytomonas sp. EM1]|nr:unnamed protein product [Phytomonas sp. EM1]|eukprot:CCW63787.1 unnamed protein product [Phytomonas sp. isolate EM1]